MTAAPAGRFGFIDRVYRTTDGGATWTPESAVTGGVYLSVYLHDAENGWIAGHNAVILKRSAATVDIDQPPLSAHPQAFELFQNFPNPFNLTTHFGFRIVEPGGL